MVRLKNCQANLFWSTATEVNSSHFLIQQSYDAKTFETLDRVESNGTIYSTQQYSFRVGVLNAPTYFRLKIVDQDGSSNFSPIIHLHPDCEIQQQRVYPSPGNELIYYEVYVKGPGVGRIEIMDSSGRQIKQIPVQVNEELNRFPIDINELASGIFTIRLRLGDAVIGMVRFTKI